MRTGATAGGCWWLMVLLAGCAQDRAEEPTERPAGAMPAGLRAAWIRAVQEDAAPRYDWSPSREATSGSVRWRVGARGLRTGADGWGVRLSTRRVGREGSMDELGAPRVEVAGNDARLVRPGIVERWVHGPLGVEHLIEVATPPSGQGALLVELTVEGLTARLDGDMVLLADAGEVRAQYTELWVEDARGAAVPSRMEVIDGRVRIRVEDAGAHYPIVIDPLVATEQARLEASDGGYANGFGASVALDGDTALVGTPGADTSRASRAGGAYVFVRSGTTWIQQAKLEANDAQMYDRFGISVALSGDTALVGADSDYTSPLAGVTGSSYVFVRSGTTWTQQAKLVPSDGMTSDRFGISVALDGNTALIGAYGHRNSRDVRTGAAYVFVRSSATWMERATLEASDGALDDAFGVSVALDGDSALIGTIRGDTSRTADAGSAYVFVRTGTSWIQQAKLESSDGAAHDWFGSAVALDGDTALVGAHRDDNPGGVGAGSAYVFVRAAAVWVQQAKLESSDGRSFDYFGRSVALRGDTALVGADEDDNPRGRGAGSSYAFMRRGSVWTQQLRIQASDGAAYDGFGSSVSLSGHTALVGARLVDTFAGTNAGSAYLILIRRMEGDACTANAQCVSGSCTDGVCCATACDGGTGDCQACSVAAGGTADGTCTALSPSMAPTVICRPSVGACDVGEICSDTSAECPADGLASAGTPCRAASGSCDVAETCTGIDVSCPPDVLIPAGIECRAVAGDCDVAETCTGVDAACPMDAFVTAGVGCRASVGACDDAEVCTGSDGACPSDALLAAGTECRAAAGECDVAETCTGSDPACPADVLAAAGSECRAGVGDCDIAEACTGTEAACPSDALLVAGTECRAASCVGQIETLEASCDGAGASCPVEVTSECAPYRCNADACGTSCASNADCGTGLSCETGACVEPTMVDGGAPDASIADAGVDGGVVIVDGGCSCRASTGSRTPLPFGLAFMLAALRRRWADRRSGRTDAERTI